MIIGLFSCKVYGGAHGGVWLWEAIGGYRIFDYDTKCTYCPLVPKRDTFYVTDGSPMDVAKGKKVSVSNKTALW